MSEILDDLNAEKTLFTFSFLYVCIAVNFDGS